MKTIIYIIDDDDAICDSLQWLLEGWGHTVKACSSIQSFFSNYENKYPSALLLDVRLNGETGTELQDILIERGYKIPIAFITGHGDVPMAVTALKKGAIDFIQKPFENDTIKNVVDKLIEKAPEYYKKQKDILILNNLTAREKQVLEGIVKGLLNKQIAGDLNISIKTVEAHRANIMHKLKVNGVADLVKFVMQND